MSFSKNLTTNELSGPSFLYNPLPDSEAAGGRGCVRGGENLLSNQSFWPHCTNTLIADSLSFLFFSCYLCTCARTCKETLPHGLFRLGGEEEGLKRYTPPPHPPVLTLLTWHVRDFIAFWIHSCTTCCSANNLHSPKLTTDERLRRQMWQVGVKKRLCWRLYWGETLSI